MVKRFEWKKYSLLSFAILLLIMNWETNKTNAAMVPAEIPQDAIRVRIVANSDSIQDQALKRVIRDEVVESMNTWVTLTDSAEDARKALYDHMPALQSLIEHELKQRGLPNEYKIGLERVPFPEKMYGGKVYPAGEYEALRITLGSGKGQNWWCVLFPPLCFGGAVTKEKAEEEQKVEKSEVKPVPTNKTGSKTDVSVKAADKTKDLVKTTASDEQQMQEKQVEPEVEARFFLWDLLQGLMDWFKGLFA